MMQRRFALAVLIAVCLPPSAAFAQSSKEDLARADSLFNAGKALVDSGDFVDACAKFAESKRLAPGLGVTLYLADCYEHVGKTASAWTEFRSAEGLARERNDKRADVAHDRAQALEPKLPRLTIALAPTISRDGVQILRDGRVVAPEEIGSAVPVDPGDHAIVVSSPGRPSKTLTAHLDAEHASAVVNIDSLEPANEGAPSAPPAPPAPPPQAAPPPVELSRPQPPRGADAGATRRWIGVGIGAAGVVGVGVGAVLGLMAKSQQSSSNGPGGCDATDHCTPQGLSDRKAAEGLAMGSTIAFIAGGVAIAGGAVLFLTAPRGASKAGIVVVPAPMVGGGGALLSATF
jgi:serine/threonine-protein kinase